MDADNLILIINKINIITETVIILQFLLSLYLLTTSTVKNGLYRGMLVLFAGSLVYHITFMLVLIFANIYYASNPELSSAYLTVVIVTCLSRMTLTGSYAYLFHMIRKHTSVVERLLDVNSN